MEITHDKVADALYIRFTKAKFAKNKKVDDFTILDLDKDGKLIGIEILRVSERIPPESLTQVNLKDSSAIA